jgi:Flp pilus assembly pilin Flp
MLRLLRRLWSDDSAQDVAEYALMLTVILLIVAGTVSLIGTNANTVFNAVAGRLSAH